MRVSSESCWGTYPEEVCLDPHFHGKHTIPRLSVKLPRETAGSFIHQFDPRSAMDVSPEERLEQYERLWAEPGFKKWLSNFYDVMVAGPANKDYAAFLRQK